MGKLVIATHKELTEIILRLRAENEKLRAALKPFADEGDLIIREAINNHFWCGNVTIGHLRAAAAALKETGDE